MEEDEGAPPKGTPVTPSGSAQDLDTGASANSEIPEPQSSTQPVQPTAWDPETFNIFVKLMNWDPRDEHHWSVLLSVF